MKILKYSLLIAGKLAIKLLLIFLIFDTDKAQAAEPQVSAWMPSWDVEEAMESLEDNKETINTLSPFWYHVNENGELEAVKNSEDEAVVEFAEDNDIPLIPTISNSFDGQKITGFLNDEARREAHVETIVDKVIEMDYDGIDIDYEGLLKEDEDVFSAFIKELSEALHDEDKLFTIAVMPKSEPMMPIFGERGQDWEELAKYVDEFRIMTYDYGWSGSVPRPVAPHYWVEEVVKYAVDHVPAEKIRLGVPFYAYAWSDNGEEGGKEFFSYTYETILDILDKYDVDVQYDPRERTNRLFYVSENEDRDVPAPYEIWFENHVSLEPKLDLVQKYNLGGIAIWRLGKEDPKNWDLIEEKLKNEPVNTSTYFQDVTEQTVHSDQINRLAFLGLIQGQGDTGLFEPLELVNRAEILKMSLNSFAIDTFKALFSEKYTIDEPYVSFTYPDPFPDVSETAWYYPYVQTAVLEDIAEGYPDGTFMPGNNIIRIEALKLALESAEIDLPSYSDSEWYKPYEQWAIDHELYAPGFILDEKITRAEAAYIIAKVIEEVEKEPQYSAFNKEKL